MENLNPGWENTTKCLFAKWNRVIYYLDIFIFSRSAQITENIRKEHFEIESSCKTLKEKKLKDNENTTQNIYWLL